MKFQYKAIDKKGNLVQGEINGEDKAHVLSQLEARELTPVIIKKSSRLEFSFSFSLFKKKVPAKDVIIFTQSLGTLIETGLSMDRALEITGNVLKDSAIKDVISDLIEEIKGGSSLAAAMSKHRDVFSGLYISMVRAAEAAGVMGTVLNSLAAYLEKSHEFKSNLISSLIYPVMLFSVSILSLAVLIIFVVPKFLNMFTTMNISPPIAIIITSNMGIFFRKFWWLIVLLIGACAYFLKYRLNKPDGKIWRDKKLLKIPYIGNLILKIENARFARTLGTLLLNGVSILQSLMITKQIISNEVLKEHVELLYVGVREGEKMASIFSRQRHLWHPALLGLASIGEETGKLPHMLTKCADMLERDVEEQLKKIISMAEPATIILMGLIIGSLIVSMLSAIFSINETVF